MIYFFQSVDGGPVKIGFTGNLDVRRKQLEFQYGCPLALLATIPGGREEEADIHERFRDIRFGRTEQFRPTLELMTFIGRPLLVGANPGAVEAMSQPMRSLVSLKGTDEFEAWLDELVNHARQGTRSLLLKNALAEYAETHGFKKAQPKR